MAKLQSPKFILVEIANTVLDVLIKGLGASAAITAATAVQPWLALPIISWIFKFAVNKFASILDENLKKSADILLIRFSNDKFKREPYDKAIEPIRSGNPTPKEIQDARDAADNLIHRGS